MGGKTTKIEEPKISDNNYIIITTVRQNKFILRSCENTGYRSIIFFLTEKKNKKLFYNFDIQIDSILLESGRDTNHIMLLNDCVITSVKNMHYWPGDTIIVLDSPNYKDIVNNLLRCEWPGLIILIDPAEDIEETPKILVYRNKEDEEHINLRLKLDVYHHLKLM